MYCSKCGKELADGALFCGTCGAKVSSSQGAPESEGGKSPAPRQPCAKCGAEGTQARTVYLGKNIDNSYKFTVIGRFSCVTAARKSMDSRDCCTAC